MDSNSRGVSSADLSHANGVKEKYSEELTQRTGVVGISVRTVGRADRKPYINLYVLYGNFEGKDRLPRELDGVPVVLVETTQIEAQED